MHWLKKSDLKEIYFPKVVPELPEKQRQAFRLALKHGYYRWPREADLGKLAQEAGVSVSTFQEHLRKAEARLLPFFAEHIDLA
ncbi:helix-turn-helix domain-containing protein [Candidatus Pacearchaeota archaeon]|nr:helix-turn-helix domain-containing protein [Candidatus Pacearchaeota archaeon]